MPIPPELKSNYEELCTPPPEADAVWNRRRGYKFEALLATLLRAEELDPRTSYKAPGEQIDGSFFLNGSVFLLEAKWHADALPASTLYQFKGKVDGKLAGTIGIFISMSGYSEDAVDALTLGKSLNLILFDKNDIDVAIFNEIGFKEVLKRKLRKAAEEGVVYFPMEAKLVTVQNSVQIDIERLGFDITTGDVYTQSSPRPDRNDLVIICEGGTDREAISILARRILEKSGSTKSIKIVAAMGKYSIPKLANALHTNNNSSSKFLIVFDGDGDAGRTLELLKQNISFPEWTAAIPDPEIEVWLGINRQQLKNIGLKRRVMETMQAAEQADIDNLIRTNKEFLAFYNAIAEN